MLLYRLKKYLKPYIRRYKVLFFRHVIKSKRFLSTHYPRVYKFLLVFIFIVWLCGPGAWRLFACTCWFVSDTLGSYNRWLFFDQPAGEAMHDLFSKVYKMHIAGLYSPGTYMLTHRKLVAEEFVRLLPLYPVWFWPICVFLALWSPNVFLTVDFKYIRFNSLSITRVTPMLCKDFIFLSFIAVQSALPLGKSVTFTDIVVLYFSFFLTLPSFQVREMKLIIKWVKQYNYTIPPQYLLTLIGRHILWWGITYLIFFIFPCLFFVKKILIITSSKKFRLMMYLLRAKLFSKPSR